MSAGSIWMGLDPGNSRIGVALSDPELSFAYPDRNIAVSGDYFYALDDVIALIEDNNVQHVVVGYPLQLDGNEGRSAKKARRFSEAVSRRLAADGYDAGVELKDERMTTVSAHARLHEAGMGMRRHRQAVDQQAAVIILQSALDAYRSSMSPQRN